MKCQDFEKEYLRDDGNVSAQALEHARSCPSCGKLLQILHLINAAGQKPSPELDQRTVNAARACLQTKQASLWSERIRTSFYAAAAALIILLSIVSLELKKPAGAQSSPIVSKSGNSEHLASLSAENAADLDTLWYLNREEANSELDILELQLSLYANLF